jgi:putative FmdB family regulatory protein
MPIYEYECEKCACRFELKRRFVEDEGTVAPSVKARSVGYSLHR